MNVQGFESTCGSSGKEGRRVSNVIETAAASTAEHGCCLSPAPLPASRPVSPAKSPQLSLSLPRARAREIFALLRLIWNRDDKFLLLHLPSSHSFCPCHCQLGSDACRTKPGPVRVPSLPSRADSTLFLRYPPSEHRRHLIIVMLQIEVPTHQFNLAVIILRAVPMRHAPKASGALVSRQLIYDGSPHAPPPAPPEPGAEKPALCVRAAHRNISS